MKRQTRAAILLLLSVAALFLPLRASAEEPLLKVSDVYRDSVYYQRLCAVALHGDYRADIVNVALSQVGYHEGCAPEDYAGGNAVGSGNYIEYSSAFYGFNGQWCAMFVSWCARQAGIPKYVVNNAARAAADGAGGSKQYYFHVNTRKPDTYTPLPGDLVFFTYDGYNSAHVGIVAEVTEEHIITVEGNSCNAVRVNEYARTSPVILRYGVYSYSEPTAPIAPIPTTELRFASDDGGDHGMMPDDADSGYSFHALWPLAETALQIPTRAFCREGYTLKGYYLRRCDDGRWLTAEQTWAAAEELRTGAARPFLLEEGSSIQWTGPLTEAAQLELHCVWMCGGLTAPDPTAAEIRPLDSEGWQNPYYDLTKNYWYYADVRTASQAGWLPYLWEFGGWRSILRGDFVTMLYRLMDSPAVEETVFSDMEAGSEGADAASWAYRAGVAKGVEEKTFCPQGQLTREQAVTMLWRLCGSEAVETAPEFPDWDQVSPWAADAVSWAVELQLLRGIPVGEETLLLPKRNMTRPEGVALVCRTADRLVEPEVDITQESGQ